MPRKDVPLQKIFPAIYGELLLPVLLLQSQLLKRWNQVRVIATTPSPWPFCCHEGELEFAG
jgi:hypothetical protein